MIEHQELSDAVHSHTHPLVARLRGHRSAGLEVLHLKVRLDHLIVLDNVVEAKGFRRHPHQHAQRHDPGGDCQGEGGQCCREEAASQDFGQDDIMDSLAEYMIDNSISTSGFHIQFGAHAKLLMFNVFANARYTIAENVVEGESGFPSAWLGLAIGF